MKKRSTSHGFSLVELSIVLVILGLLTGGILAGQSLIRASEVRSILTEADRYRTASMSFRDKYFGLPGDITNATSFWGSSAGTGSDSACGNSVQTGVATCNGNGDGAIDSDISGVAGYLLFWKHLANAGLIEGSFAGTISSNGGYSNVSANITTQRPGWNTPYARVGSGFWDLQNRGGWNAAIQKFYGAYVAISAGAHYTNSLFMLPTNGTDVWSTNGGVISTTEMWGIDTKIDDGRPGSGKVEAFRGASSGDGGPCLTAGDPATAAYALTVTSKLSCAPIFVGLFR